ncbi:MAG: hypothetical protein DRG82_15505 [Deltaproteobacteria bacterium]|nr:MAG: hypothetical protein DRG82_15505 [Deltaproteobacteria bacterium]
MGMGGVAKHPGRKRLPPGQRKTRGGRGCEPRPGGGNDQCDSRQVLMIDMEWSPRTWVAIGQMVYNIVISLYLWVSRRYQATNERVDEVKERLSSRIEEIEKSVVRISTDISHIPSRAELNGLREDIRYLTSELGEMKGRLGGINRVADIMNEYLINKDK